jgi:lysyl-tRNA synthetase class 2
MELANCFTELCDPDEQRRRFAAAKEERMQLKEADYPVDEEFLSVLGEIDSAAGVALGVDRLVMTLLDVNDMSHVRQFD